MVVPSRPKSNAQRQREFRARNPGYYIRLRARHRAEAPALLAQDQAATQAAAMKRAPLMLPAPVETIEIPGMTTIRPIAQEAYAFVEVIQRRPAA